MQHNLEQLSLANRRKVLLYLYWLHVQERFFPKLVFSRGLTRPVLFALQAGSFALLILSFMPLHPASIPASFGAGLSITIITTSIRRVRFVHYVGQ